MKRKKLIIEIPENMLHACQWHRDKICEITEIERDILIEEVTDGVDAVEMLMDLKNEIMESGNWRSDCEISNDGVKDCLAIIDRHIAEIRGD